MKCEGGRGTRWGLKVAVMPGKVSEGEEGTGWGEGVLIGYVEGTVLCAFFFFFCYAKFCHVVGC